MALGKRRSEEDSQIDLTPMLDIVFIMLIFFIITASFVKESGVEVDTPPTTQQPSADARNIVFVVSDNGDITLEGRRVDIRSVRASVERIHAENPEAKVIINASPQARTAIFVEISDQAREAGVYDIALAAKK